MTARGQVSLHVIESLGRGGAERLLATTVSALAARGDRPIVAVLRAPYDLESEIAGAGVSVVHLNAARRWSLWFQARAIARLAKDVGATVIHAHLYFPAVTCCLARMLRMTSANVFVTFHNLAYAPGVNPAGLGLKFKMALARLVYPFGAHKLLAVSQAVADHYQSALGLSRIDVLHNGVNLALVSGISATTDSKRLRIVTPGRLAPEKGHFLMLEALSALAEAGVEFEAVFVGGGKLEQAIRDKADALNLGDHLRITGNVPHAELLSEVAAADLVAIPSLHEGFGLTAVEAMALGRPVIASRAGGLPEVLNHGQAGRLVETGSAAAMSAALRELATDEPMRRSLGNAGQEQAKAFSMDTIIDRLSDMYAAADKTQDGRG